MTVYHGSTTTVKAPLVGVGRSNLDFGQGFYVTDLQQQAIAWANRPINQGKPKVLNVYHLDVEGAIQAGFRYKHFKAYDAEWLEFVVSSRRGEPVWQELDMIEGGIANDRVFNTIELYSQGLITQELALQRLRYEKPNNQICILNQAIVDRYMSFIESTAVNGEEDGV